MHTLVRVESLFQQSIRNRNFAFLPTAWKAISLVNSYGGGSRRQETGAADGHSVFDVLPRYGRICQGPANDTAGTCDAVYLCKRKVEEGPLPDFGI